MKNIKAVIFDMDGVLLDTEPIYTDVTQAVLNDFNKRFEWSLKAKMIGRNNIEAATILIEELKIPITPQAFLDRQEIYFNKMFPRCEPMPGVVDFVKQLKERDIPMAVATSSSNHFFTIKTERHRDWFQLFSTIVTGDDSEVKACKPAPDLFLTAANRLKVEPENCLVFEDAVTGIQAGKTAGMSVIAIPDEHMDRKAYIIADRVISNFEEIDLNELGI